MNVGAANLLILIGVGLCAFMKPSLVSLSDCLNPHNLPAMHAVIKQATVPATSALIATEAKSPFLSGAIGVRPPNWMPIDPTLAKPHKAYVAITSERNCKAMIKRWF